MLQLSCKRTPSVPSTLNPLNPKNLYREAMGLEDFYCQLSLFVGFDENLFKHFRV